MCIHRFPLTIGSTVRDNLPYLVLWCPDCGAHGHGQRPKGPHSDRWTSPSPPKEDNSETQAEKYRSALESILANEIEEGREFGFTASRSRLALHGPSKEP
jgi:hypothetical protein